MHSEIYHIRPFHKYFHSASVFPLLSVVSAFGSPIGRLRRHVSVQTSFPFCQFCLSAFLFHFAVYIPRYHSALINPSFKIYRSRDFSDVVKIS
jgi:hypothetical protein